MPDKPKTTLSKSEINRRHYKKRVEKARKEGKVSKAATKPVTKPDLVPYQKFPQMSRPTFVQKDRFTGLNIPIFI